MPTETVQVPPGYVAMTTYGSLVMEMVQSYGEMRSAMEREGLTNIKWEFVPGMLVDMARNQAVARMLSVPEFQWLAFIDGDCVFQPDALKRLLLFAYKEMPSADIVGAYNPLRADPFLPTIDTGTGTWESHLPNSGPMQVMRTGSAFLLIKRHVFERLGGPWYGIRNIARPIDALADVDNYACQKFDGHNPLATTPEWQALLGCAKAEGSTFQPPDPIAATGEDSGLCDRMKLAGMNLWVHTDIICGHVDRKVITALDHRAAMRKRDDNRRLLVGCQR
jgi:hypothetical protein